MEWISDPEIWTALVTLTALEIVLGVDNVVFISILASKLHLDEQKRARQVGLALAMGGRLLLLAMISVIIGLTEPIFTIFDEEFSGRDLILIAGGLFLLAKSTFEIHERLEGQQGHTTAKTPASFTAVIIQILLMDVIFSLDSVITAVGTADDIEVMMAAVVIAVLVMLLMAEAISGFVNEHPTVKILALSFLLLIGMSLVAEGLDQHIPKGYVYFAMAFSVFVEMLNLRIRTRAEAPVQLRDPYTPEAEAEASPGG
jgi:predicted tellurium resistance membrane protein TerC